MKVTELSMKPRISAPCALVTSYAEHVMAAGTLTTWLQGFDFESKDEIEATIISLMYAIRTDPYMNIKEKRNADPVMQVVFKQAEVLLNKVGAAERQASVMGAEIWNKHFAPLKREQRFLVMFSEKPNRNVYDTAVGFIKSIYGLSDYDIDKLRFFVEMVKARDNFPASLRRMLYIWGRTKKTGKTTVAKMLTAALNGSKDWQRCDPDFTTTLANEMQIGGFKVPKIATCECAMMDECFYSDMGKTYHDFKRFLTSSGGSARLPYGQEFQWYGRPNYIATSNEPLRTFIKDWNDRRFLSVEFKGKPEQHTFEELNELWVAFVVNSTKRFDKWAEWADTISNYSDEDGERSSLSYEYNIELQRKEFLYTLTGLMDGKSATSADNQITLKFFVNYFGNMEGQSLANAHRREIEAAVVDVFGEKWQNYNFWRLDTLRKKAQEILNEQQTL